MLRYRLLRSIVRLILGIIAKMEIFGLENVPLDEPFILAINHPTFLDSPILMATMPLKVTPLVFRKWQNVFWTAILLNMAGVIFIDRDEIGPRALRATLKILKKGGVIGIAPEGRQTNAAELFPGKPGTAYLATKANVPVLPIGLSGHINYKQDLRQFRRFPIKVNIGRPIYFARPDRADRDEQLKTYTEQIMVAIACLVEPEMRGMYAQAVSALNNCL